MRIDGMHGQGQSPATGQRQGCPLSATLLGLFIDGVHHYLQSVVPTGALSDYR